MELSKLTICRQDVIIVSDSEADSNNVNSNKKKKHKRKPQCVRNVKLTKVTVNRIVPYCYRESCRSSEHYHRQTSMNTKYHKRKLPPIDTKHKKSQASVEGILCESDKNDEEISMELSRNMYSPITVTSSSEMYENVSSCSFNVLSSDSDELEDLINLTRKRMKNSKGNFDRYPLRKHAATTQDDYRNISSNDEVLNDSVHSMDTVVLYHGNARQRSPVHNQMTPERHNQVNLKSHKNNNIEPMLLCESPNLNNNKVLNQKIPCLSNQENNNDLSPLYEISGKVFMEHYLNTSFI